MTKKQALRDFRETVLPVIRAQENRQGRYKIDSIMRREEWSNYTDMLCKEGEITLRQYETWDNPF